MKILLLIILINISSCKKAVLDHPAEGAGGLIIGTNLQKNTPPSLSVSGVPATLEEGNTAIVAIKLTQKITDKKTFTISSDSPALLINNAQSISSDLTPENSTVDNLFTLFAEADANQVSETVNLTITVPGIETKSFSLSITDKYTRLIQVNGDSSLAEETQSSFSISLGIKPDSDVLMTVSSSDTNSVQFLSTTNLTFTSSNYKTAQIINYKINDIYNDNRVYTFTFQTDTETKTFNVTLIDNDFVLTDLAAGQSILSLSPSLALDTSKNTMVTVATGANSENMILTRCDLTGNNCSFTDLSSGQPLPYTYKKPSIAIDSGNNRLYVAQAFPGYQSSGATSLFRCTMNMSGIIDTCNYSNSYVTSFSNSNTTWWPRIYLNPSISKLFIIEDNEFSARLQVCQLDGTGCSTTNLGTTTTVGGIGSRGTDFDSVNSKLISTFNATNSNGNFRVPVVIQTNADGTGKQSFIQDDFSQNNLLITPDLKIDTVNSKVILLGTNVTAGNKLYIIRKNLSLTGTGEFLDVSAGITNLIYYPKLNIDIINQKLLIIGYDSNSKPFLSYCNLDGTSCKYADISKGQNLKDDINGPHFDSAIDTVNNRLIVVFTNKSTFKLNMIRFGLGGF